MQPRLPKIAGSILSPTPKPTDQRTLNTSGTSAPLSSELTTATSTKLKISLTAPLLSGSPLKTSTSETSQDSSRSSSVDSCWSALWQCLFLSSRKCPRSSLPPFRLPVPPKARISNWEEPKSKGQFLRPSPLPTQSSTNLNPNLIHSLLSLPETTENRTPLSFLRKQIRNDFIIFVFYYIYTYNITLPCCRSLSLTL